VPLHPQAKAICDLTNAARVTVAPEDRVRLTREGWGLFLAMAGGPSEPVFAVDDRDADGVPVRIYRPTAAPGLPIFVVLHGGGWVIGAVEQFDVIARQLANASGAVVVSVDYRLAPEHPYPAGLDDCFRALQWTAAHAAEISGDPARIAIGGDSAGGNLAVVCALRARDEGGPDLALQVLVYPVCDCNFETDSYVANGKGHLLETEEMQWFFDHYANSSADFADWRMSPLRAPDLTGLPAAVVITAEYDPLRDQGEAYAQRLRDAGVPTQAVRGDGLFHGFFGMHPFLPPARAAWDTAIGALRAAFGSR
jgi:acetyl esterase